MNRQIEWHLNHLLTSDGSRIRDLLGAKVRKNTEPFVQLLDELEHTYLHAAYTALKASNDGSRAGMEAVRRFIERIGRTRHRCIRGEVA